MVACDSGLQLNICVFTKVFVNTVDSVFITLQHPYGSSSSLHLRVLQRSSDMHFSLKFFQCLQVHSNHHHMVG